MAKSKRLPPLGYDAKPGESNKAIQACNDWLRLGPGRKLTTLIKQYKAKPEVAATQHYNTLQMWSQKYDWPTRAPLYDEQIEAQKNERARAIMLEGLALDYERVDKLKALFDKLEAELEQGALWLSDVKQIGAGEFTTRVDIERYNSALISDLRGLLDDLAKETGGRVTRQDVTSKGQQMQIIGIEAVIPNDTNEPGP